MERDEPDKTIRLKRYLDELREAEVAELVDVSSVEEPESREGVAWQKQLELQACANVISSRNGCVALTILDRVHLLCRIPWERNMLVRVVCPIMDGDAVKTEKALRAGFRRFGL